MRDKRSRKRRYSTDMDDSSTEIRAKSPHLSNDNSASSDDEIFDDNNNGNAQNLKAPINSKVAALQLLNGGGNLTKRNELTPLRARNKDAERKSLPLTPLANQIFAEENMENENLERQQRLQHRVVAHNRRSILNGGLSTPDRSMILNGRQSLEPNAIPAMNAVQLKDHYTACIKLSATNKINAKNAFSLHLIDLMSEVIKSSNDDLNFRLAGSTLDAGAKIYSNRVDCVHSGVQKAASGLIMALDKDKKKSKDDNNDEAEDNDGNDMDMSGSGDGEVNVKKKKKKVSKSGKTIAQNLETINVTKLETNIEIDPVFRSISSEFDSGSPLSLLMYNLNCDARNQMILQSNKPYNSLFNLDDEFKRSLKSSSVRCSQFRVCFQNIIDSSELGILKKLKSFNFRERNSDESFILGQDSISELRRASELKSSYVFSNNELSDDDIDTAVEDDYFDNEDIESCLLPPSAVTKNSILKAVNLEGVNYLSEILSMKPGDYTYFNGKIQLLWAGPTHWKTNPFLKFQLAKKALQQQQQQQENELAKVKKTKKQVVDRNFHMETLNPKLDKKDNEGLKLKVTTLKKWTSDSETKLPVDHCYCLRNLICPFNINKATFKTASGGRIPVANDDDDDVDKDVIGEKDNDAANSSIGGDDFFDGPNLADTSVNHDEDYKDDDDDNFASDLFSDTAPTSLIRFTGDNLIEQPHFVQQIKLPYTTTAKKMDVKRLKKAMWDILSKAANTIPVPQKVKLMSSPVKFDELYKDIKPRITTSMAKNLSPQIAFVTLLHLANEKILDLVGSTDLKNIDIKPQDSISP